MSQELTVIARNHAEMVAAKEQLVAWATAKRQAVEREFQVADQNCEIAKREGWVSDGFRQARLTARNRLIFYEKLQAIVEAGYVIVPNFPIDIFAVRTDKTEPPRTRSFTPGGVSDITSERPALGTGEYVADRPALSQYQTTKTNYSGETVPATAYFSSGFRDIDFPIKGVQPHVLDDLSRAMALSAFDEIGILPERRNKRVDPMVVGQIVYKVSQYNVRRISFLITWWLDEAHLIV